MESATNYQETINEIFKMYQRLSRKITRCRQKISQVRNFIRKTIVDARQGEITMEGAFESIAHQRNELQRMEREAEYFIL